MERTLNALRGAGWKVAQHIEKADGRVEWTITHPERDPLTTEAENDTTALSHLLKRAGMAPERNFLHDNGPWSVGIEKDRTHRVFIQSEDQTSDVRLYVDGDFGHIDECRTYAENLAVELNAIPKVAAPAAKVALRTRLGATRERIVASPKVRAVATVAAVVVVMLIAMLISSRQPDPRAAEARADAYIDAKTAFAVCPAVAPELKQALGNGRLSVGEAQALHDIVQRAADDYKSGSELNQARAALGLSVYPLPPRCSGIRPQKGDDTGPTTDLFEDYRVEDHD